MHELEFTMHDFPIILALAILGGLLTFIPEGYAAMKRWMGIGLVIGLSVVSLDARQWAYKKNLDDITIAGTAANVFSSSDILAGAAHPQATLATCTLVTANIRITIDGQTPTTSFGEVLTPGAWTFSGVDVLLNLKGIRDDSTSGVLSCTLYGS